MLFRHLQEVSVSCAPPSGIIMFKHDYIIQMLNVHTLLYKYASSTFTIKIIFYKIFSLIDGNLFKHIDYKRYFNLTDIPIYFS